MKEWWENLSLRERGLVGGSAALTVILLLYILVWEPVRDTDRRLRRGVAEQREELNWMRQAEREIKRLHVSGSAQSTPDQRSLLTRVDQTARAAGLGAALKRIVPQSGSRLSAQLDAVEFKPFIIWLETLEQNHRITIVNLNVNRTQSSGRVNARVIFQENQL